MTQILNVKKAFLACIALTAALLVSVTLCAGSALAATNTYCLDGSGVLTADESATLESKAASASQSSGIGLYLVYVDDIGSSAVRDYAKSLYVSQGLGLGTNKSGIMFLIATQSRDYVTITYAKGVDAFADDYISYMEEQIVEPLHDNDWYEGGLTYVNLASDALTYYASNGSAIEVPESGESYIFNLLIALIAALIAAFVVLKGKKAQMKTAREAKEANAYLDQGSFNLEYSDDVYVGTTVICIKTHAEKQQENRSHSIDSGGFGGSSGGKF